jgi:hypothetical protein
MTNTDTEAKRHGRTWVRTCRCGATVTTTGICGPTSMCKACTDELLAIFWGKVTGQAARDILAKWEPRS